MHNIIDEVKNDNDGMDFNDEDNTGNPYAKYLPTDMMDIEKQYAVMSITFMDTAINALNKKGQNAETGNIKQVETASSLGEILSKEDTHWVKSLYKV